ncbi:MAG TPA: hypothetical protein VEL76_26155 [Gemmataceae bacterium]|nr:hypothetical protein [Gemmataceae bacterium]
MPPEPTDRDEARARLLAKAKQAAKLPATVAWLEKILDAGEAQAPADAAATAAVRDWLTESGVLAS